MGIYGGTTQKCNACEKTVYLVDQLTTDGIVYHTSCFRCHHCKRILKMSNFSSFEGVPYCKPHFDQLFKRTGSLQKSFEGAPKTPRAERSSEQNQGYTNNRVSSFFGGTQEKCVACKKTVYPIEKVAVDGDEYHKSCFRCSHGRCVISPSNYITHDHKLYCRHHHSQLFKQKGNFSQLDSHSFINGTTASNHSFINGTAMSTSANTTASVAENNTASKPSQEVTETSSTDVVIENTEEAAA
ncbi:hypothetical protein Drorol1_Dr00004492 [Drosera rotundifolia]